MPVERADLGDAQPGVCAESDGAAQVVGQGGEQPVKVGSGEGAREAGALLFLRSVVAAGGDECAGDDDGHEREGGE